YGGTLNIINDTFSRNYGSDGGAILSSGGELTITDANFVQNRGSFGGAVFEDSGEIALNVSDGRTSLFSGNDDYVKATSIYLEDSNGATSLVVNVGKGGTLDMRDPM